MLERLERQEKLTANQWKIIATANVGDMLDFFDFFLIGYVATVGKCPAGFMPAGLSQLPSQPLDFPPTFYRGFPSLRSSPWRPH